MSVKKNFLYNTAITISSYVVSFVVFPYISRVLGVSNIGIVGYVDNIINYFVLVTCLGVSTVGIREISAVSHDREKASIVFFQILSFLLTTLFISVVIYTLCIFQIPTLAEYRRFFLIGLCKLLFTPLLIEWLYCGFQDFKYISIRTISIKVIYLLSIFLFVRNENDTDIYFILTSISVLLNAVINLYTARKYINFNKFTYDPIPFLKPITGLGVFAIITSLYSTFNYVYLGSVASPGQVGLYYTSIKIYDVIMQVYRSYTSVIMPRMSQLASTSNAKGFEDMINKSYEVLFAFCIPTAIITMLIAPFVIYIIAGSGYEDAVIVMRVIMPVLLIAGINQTNGVQVLMPLKKDKVLIITGSIAAIVGVISNIMFDSQYGALGAAITILASEFTGCLCGISYITRCRLFQFPYLLMFKYLITSFPYIIIHLLCIYLIPSFFTRNIITLTLMIFYFVVQQIYICKNTLFTNMLSKCIIRRNNTKK